MRLLLFGAVLVALAAAAPDSTFVIIDLTLIHVLTRIVYGIDQRDPQAVAVQRHGITPAEFDVYYGPASTRSISATARTLPV